MNDVNPAAAEAGAATIHAPTDDELLLSSARGDAAEPKGGVTTRARSLLQSRRARALRTTT